MADRSYSVSHLPRGSTIGDGSFQCKHLARGGLPTKFASDEPKIMAEETEQIYVSLFTQHNINCLNLTSYQTIKAKLQSPVVIAMLENESITIKGSYPTEKYCHQCHHLDCYRCLPIAATFI